MAAEWFFWESCGLHGHLTPHFASVGTTIASFCIFASTFCSLFPLEFIIFLAPPWPLLNNNLKGLMSASNQMSTEKSQSSQPSKVVQPDEYWKASTTMVKDLTKLRERGLLPDP